MEKKNRKTLAISALAIVLLLAFTAASLTFALQAPSNAAEFGGNELTSVISDTVSNAAESSDAEFIEADSSVSSENSSANTSSSQDLESPADTDESDVPNVSDESKDSPELGTAGFEEPNTSDESEPSEEEVTTPSETEPQTPSTEVSAEHKCKFTTVSNTATCTKDGEEKQICSICGKEKFVSSPATGHHFKEETTHATCYVDGWTKTTCTYCGESNTTSIPATEHNYVVEDEQKATTSSKGYVYYRCTNCGDWYKETLTRLTAKEADLCGDSLVGKILHHASNTQEFGNLLAFYNVGTSNSASDSVYNLSGLSFYKTLDGSYNYLSYLIVNTTTADSYGSMTLYTVQSDVSSQYTKTFARAQEILNSLGITKNTTVKDAVTLINNWLCDNKALSESASDKNNVYAALFNDKITSEQYALAFQILCLQAGIECHYATDANGHAVNRVFFSDDTSLWVDVARNDSGSDRSRYLLVNDDQL